MARFVSTLVVVHEASDLPSARRMIRHAIETSLLDVSEYSEQTQKDDEIAAKRRERLANRVVIDA